MAHKETEWFRSNRVHRNKKKTRHSKSKLLSIALSIAAIFGVVKGVASQKQSHEKNTSIASTLTTLNQTPQQYQYLATPFQQQTPTSVLDNPPIVPNSISNQLFQTLQSYVPKKTSTNTVWLYTSVLQKLSTGEDDVCTALNMPSSNFVHFIQLAQSIPTNELQKIIDGQKTMFDFAQLQQAFQNPTNTFAFAQTSFEQQSRYQLLNRLTISLPLHEGNTDYIYWDTSTDDDDARDPQPTISVGLNLKARPDLLRRLHFKNSDFIQAIIHPDPKDRTSEKYIQLTPKELDRLTAHARKNNWDKAAEHYKKVYGLCVRADEKVILDTYFLNKLASCITRTEQELDSLKPADFSDGSALFGTYLTPLTGAPDVACDIKWNTGNNLPDDWPKFCRHYLNRNFAGARTESHVQKEPLRRRWWKNRCMNQSIINQIKYQHQRTAKLLNNNK